MKNKILPVMIILAALLIISCKKTGASAKSENAEPVLETSAQAYATPGYVLVRDSGFYVIDDNTGEETDKSRWSASLSLGERVFIGEARKATYTNDNKVYDYMAIRRNNGNEGYILPNRVASGSYLAVVTDDRAALYRSPNAIDVSNTILSRKTVVVYYPESETGGFVKIAGYDPEKQAYIQSSNNYIRTTSISRKETDIQSCILLQTALALDVNTQKVRRDALLDAALVDYPDSVFHPEILAVVHPNMAGAVIRTVAMPVTSMKVNDDNVNVRDQAGTNGRVVGQIHDGDSVTVNERTSDTDQVNGQTAYWYKITSPVEGWVFGAFLTN
jgi:hypothetical protein